MNKRKICWGEIYMSEYYPISNLFNIGLFVFLAMSLSTQKKVVPRCSIQVKKKLGGVHRIVTKIAMYVMFVYFYWDIIL